MLLRAMRVFVIGGTGFIGPFVVSRLANLGHHVAVYHRGLHEPALPFGVEHLHSPLAASPVLAFPAEATSLAWDVVLAMAPLAEADASALMRAFRGIARRVVAVSSGDVYRAYGILQRLEEGPVDESPLREETPLRSVLYPYRDAPGIPEHLRGRGYEKIEVERVVLADPDLPGTILRLPAVYGPGDPQGRFSQTISDLDAGVPVVLGDSYARWRWTHGYVENVADAIVLAVIRERARGRVYNVGEDPTPTVADRIRELACAALPVVQALASGSRGHADSVVVRPDAEAPPGPPGRPRLDQPLVYDTSRIRAELDWAEAVSRDEAWRRTLAWERGPGKRTPAGAQA